MFCHTRRIFATLLLFVTIIGLVMSFGENVLCAGELPGAHDTVARSHEHAMSQSNESSCPCDQSPSDSSSDHFCIGDCGCPCHAPLLSSAITLTQSSSSTCIFYTEQTRHIPEVFLSLFVPPDSATA